MQHNDFQWPDSQWKTIEGEETQNREWFVYLKDLASLSVSRGSKGAALTLG